jgi:hypothetical protein
LFEQHQHPATPVADLQYTPTLAPMRDALQRLPHEIPLLQYLKYTAKSLASM